MQPTSDLCLGAQETSAPVDPLRHFRGNQSTHNEGCSWSQRPPAGQTLVKCQVERATVKSSNTGREKLGGSDKKYERNSFWIHEDEELPKAGAHVRLCTIVGQLHPRTTPRCRKRHHLQDKKVAMNESHVTESEVRMLAGPREPNSGG